jgi:hypothetical protein
MGPGAIALRESYELRASRTSGADPAGAEPEFRRPRWATGTTDVAARHKDLAALVGASRPRITEYLACLSASTCFRVNAPVSEW